MAYEKLSFSRSVLLALPPAPTGKRAYYSDTKEPGLCLCVTATGTKSFQVYLKQNGRPVRVTLGRFSGTLADGAELPKGIAHAEFLANAPELNVRMARALAAMVKIDLKSGNNPIDVKRQKRTEVTLGQLMDIYISDHMIPHQLKTTETVRCDFNRYLGDVPKTPKSKHGAERGKPKGAVNWANRPISTITPTEVKKLHAEYGRTVGQCAANKSLTILRFLFSKAKAWGYLKGDLPTTGIKKYPQPARERFIVAHELPRFFAALAQEENQDIRDYALISILTGARCTNVVSMRWEDLRLEQAIWELPRAQTKNKKSLLVPLTRMFHKPAA